MQHPFSENNSVSYCRAFFLLLVLIFVIHSNSLRADWHLDDFDIILKNPRIKITGITSTTFIQTFFASIDGGQYSSSKLYRPLPNLTFALNWYLGKDNVYGFLFISLPPFFCFYPSCGSIKPRVWCPGKRKTIALTWPFSPPSSGPRTRYRPRRSPTLFNGWPRWPPCFILLEYIYTYAEG